MLLLVLGRGEVAERGVATPRVLEALHALEDLRGQLLASRRGAAVHELLLQGREECLGNRVVLAVTLGPHRSADPSLLARLPTPRCSRTARAEWWITPGSGRRQTAAQPARTAACRLPSQPASTRHTTTRPAAPTHPRPKPTHRAHQPLPAHRRRLASRDRAHPNPHPTTDPRSSLASRRDRSARGLPAPTPSTRQRPDRSQPLRQASKTHRVKT